MTTRIQRRTIVVHTRLAGHMARVEAARAAEHGVQIMTMGQLAARLAGGLLRPIDREDLLDAVRTALPAVDLGELQSIRDLPGMVRAAAGTLEKVWNANIDLAGSDAPRLQALAALEREVLRALPAGMKRPSELAALASARLEHAPAILGAVELRGHSEMPPCWRGLLAALAERVPVRWIAGPRFVPAWLRNTKVDVCEEAAAPAKTAVLSCANPEHEVVEAFRWTRSLLAAGTARPEDIAIVAASTSELDDLVLAAARDANIAVHFVGGVRAVTRREGQAAAALAEVVLKGLSQERVRRLFALLRGSSALRDLPPDWTRVLPLDAPLATLERWEQVLARRSPADWPDGNDRSKVVLDVLRLVARGADAAEDIGRALLAGLPLRLWLRGLKEGPAAALPTTLSRMRIDDAVDPASSVLWTSASALASVPRRYVRLLAVNASRWPRGISEDRLIPDHVIATSDLDPLPIATADKRDFATILASARSVSVSFSRRDVDGRRLGESSLIPSNADVAYLARARTPEHAASESDRLLARPSEFRATPVAASAVACWRDWYRGEITAHDGLIGREHPRLQKVLATPQSATSLQLLLRDPIRFVWRYALGWKQPEEVAEPLTLEALAFGNLVHRALERTVGLLEQSGGFSAATPNQVTQAVAEALEQTRRDWEVEQPVPPPLIWRSTLERVRRMMTTALLYDFSRDGGQRSWTEVPFGNVGGDDDGSETAVPMHGALPWDTSLPVEIPGTGITIRGQIDRLDLSGDRSRARVIDYKTGKLPKNMAGTVIGGGRELQRCLYAFAVRTLVGDAVRIEAGLLYPGAPAGADAWYPLAELDDALARVSTATRCSKEALLEGIAPPGTGAGDSYNEHRFALPASATYLTRKHALAAAALGEAAKVWGEA